MTKKKIKQLEKKLSLLTFLKSRQKKNNTHHILDCLNDESIKFLCECICNGCSPETFEGVKPSFKKKIVNRYKNHKSEINKIISPKISLKKKRKIIQEGNGWFVPLLTTIVPLIASLLLPK
jgi:hypothetical protein